MLDGGQAQLAQQEAEAGLQRRRSRPSGRAVAVTVVGAAVMVCLSAIGVWSVL